MTNNGSVQSGGGVGFTGLLFIVFLVLKLTDVISWSWWFVTAPLWAPVALILVGGVLFAVGAGIAAAVRKSKKNTSTREARRALDNYSKSFLRPPR